MAVQFGIITAASGVTGISLTDVTISHGADIADARDSSGKVTDLKAYSKNTTLTCNGYLTYGGSVIEAGTSVTVDGTTYIVESAEQVESNTEFVRYNLTMRTADSATISAIS